MADIRSILPFKNGITESFQEITRKYDLKFFLDTNEIADIIRLVGSNIELHFTYDRGDLRCSFYNPITRKKYLVNLVYELLYPGENRYKFSVNDPEGLIENFSKVIEERLSNVMLGDFSWSSNY